LLLTSVILKCTPCTNPRNVQLYRHDVVYRRRARNWCQFVGRSYYQNINQNLSILNLAIHSMSVEINSLYNLFLVSETIKSICHYNCNEKNLKNRNESEILM
jgi:hypothetical protein